MKLEEKLNTLPVLLDIANKHGFNFFNVKSDYPILNRAEMMRMIVRSLDKSLNNIFPIEEIAHLIANKDYLDNSILSVAKDVNLEIHKKEIGFYAVSYISDYCINGCLYCGHSKDVLQNRKILTENEMLLDFTRALNLGPSEICILAGEHKLVTPERLARAINIAKLADVNHGLDRVILNVAPMTIGGFQDLRDRTEVPIQFRIFQESYDKLTYEKNHPIGPKADFSFRLHAQERALDAGINDVGIGALLGLNVQINGNDFEILSLITHAYHLLETKGKLPYSLSIPRLQPVSDKYVAMNAAVSDTDYLRYHAILRLALPYTKIIVTTRETPEMQNLLRPLINIHDLNTKPGVGGNYKNNIHMQNSVSDNRHVLHRILEIRNQGYSVILKNI